MWIEIMPGVWAFDAEEYALPDEETSWQIDASDLPY